MGKLSKAICTKNYDPYFGFKVIQQGEQVLIRVLKGHLYHIETLSGHLLGTVSSDDCAMHFEVSK